MSSLGRNEVTYKSSVLLLAKIKHGCGLVSPAISVPKDKYDMQQIQRCMILFFQFLNNFLCGFASSFYQNIHCGTLLWEKHQLPADHQAGWPLCKLWEHRFPVPDLACPPPRPRPVNMTHALCMRMHRYGLLKCHRGILFELFTFTASICRLFFWSWMTYTGNYVPQTCSLRYRGIFPLKVSLL